MDTLYIEGKTFCKTFCSDKSILEFHYVNLEKYIYSMKKRYRANDKLGSTAGPYKGTIHENRKTLALWCSKYISIISKDFLLLRKKSFSKRQKKMQTAIS